MTESMALTVVEQPDPPPIKANQLIIADKEGADNAPDSKNPFYILYQEGLFLHVRSELGRAIIPADKAPKSVKSLGAKGYFWWKASRIPPELCAQAVSFFKRAWETHKTEAGVILLMHYETKEWSIFVPTQKVSGAAVEYVYEPSDIPEKHVIMGTMHSHCNFSPFHSGTDMADAEDMNGVHFTVGYVDKEPKAVAMVSWNGKQFDFEPNDVADFTQLDIAEAPIEWDEKLIPTRNMLTEKQKELFEKYGPKPTYSTYTPYSGRYVDNWDDIPDDWRELYGFPKYSEQKQLYIPSRATPPSQKSYSPNSWSSTYWEDHLDPKIVDYIFDSGLITDEDIDNATANPADAQDTTYWIALFLSKMSRTVNVLDKLGFVVDYHIKTKKLGATDKTYDVVADVVKLLHEFDETTIIKDERSDDSILEGEYSEIDGQTVLPLP